VATATTAVMTVATTAPLVLLAPAHAGGNLVAVVDVPDDDVPPPGWGQWESLPAPAPEPLVGVLVMRENDCVMSGRPTHGAEASLSAPPFLHQMAPQRVRRRSGRASTRRRPTSVKPRPSRCHDRNSVTTASRSTGR
jgi:hypothetical protein